MKRLVGLSLCGLLACSLAAYAAPDRSGEQIYNSACATCHATGVANAPKVHDQAAWEARYKDALTKVKLANPALSSKDQDNAAMNYMIGIIKKGMNAMPPGGMCNDCNDNEYKAAIKFMRSKK